MDLNIISYPFKLVEDRNDDGDYGVCINFAHIANVILLPQFDIGTDEIALDGGVLICVTWNIMTER